MKLFKRFAPKIAYFATLITLMVAMGFVALYLAVGPGLPEVESIRKIRLQTPMSIYANDGQLIDEFGDQRRIPITLDQVPKDFINALLSTEDQRFYEHSGVDFLGVFRAFINLAVTQTKSQGASTITMLVARNYYLTREKRFSRKFTEMFLAWKIESELTKNEILELFLNKIPFGHRAEGLGAASQVYYGTTLDNLSIAQLATLAGIPKGQSIYNPISYPEKARSRRAHVLGRMLTENYISQPQYDAAMAEPIETRKHGARKTVDAPFLAEMVRQEVIKIFGRDKAYNDGLKIFTTLDAKLQQFAQQSLIEGLEEYDRRHGYRGAEQQYELSEVAPEHMLTWLQDVPVVANLQPALVTAVAKEKAAILLKNGDIGELQLEDVNWARKYVDENHRGPKITEVAQVLTAGDVIRVRGYQVKVQPTPAAEATADNVEPAALEPIVQQRYKLAQIPDVSGGFVSLEPHSGAIEVLVGGYNFVLNQFNMVTQARRQPGSNIKPFVYSAAFDKDFTAASMINDSPIVETDRTAENIWRPKNDSDNYAGPTSLRTGLTWSKNTVSVRLVRKIGASYTKQYLEQVGFPGEHMQPFLSLALGSASFTPMEVVAGYAVLANGGYKVSPWFIDKIENAAGQIIFQAQPTQVCVECEEIIAKRNEQALSSKDTIASTGTAAISAENIVDVEAQEEIEALPLSSFENLPILPIPEEMIAPRVIEQRNHFIIDHILKDVIHKGTAWRTLFNSKSPLLKRHDIAGKTGTTNDAKDAWFSGYNRRHVATAWVGFDDHAKKLGNKEFGGKAALPIWQKFMEKALNGTDQVNFTRPEGLTTVRIDPENGLLANSLTKNPKFELFRSENAPTEYAEKPIENIYDEKDEKVEDDNVIF